MKIALIQQHATDDKAINIQRGLDNIDTAAANGAECAMFAELAYYSLLSTIPCSYIQQN